MSTNPVFEKIAQLGVIPVVALDSVEAALPLADALLEGGLPIIEITFRTSAAAEAIQAICQQRPEMLVGAGTVLSIENAEAAKAAGAKFALAPGLNPQIVAHAQEIGLPFVPGVATASDVECGLSMGCSTLKFFPSEAMGGINTIKALAAPFSHTPLRFVPTGGVNTKNLPDYIASPAVSAVGGTWLAKKEDLAEGRWDEIQRRASSDFMPNPTGRLGRVEEVGHLVAYLSSPHAGYINGSNLRIDGGTADCV